MAESHLSASGPETGRIPSIDGLRSIGLILVFSFHAWEFAGRPALGPISDVVEQNTRPDLFVVLTGFCLYLPFAIDRKRFRRFDIRSYLVRRLRRIVPPYYVALSLPILIPLTLKFGHRIAGGEPAGNVWPSAGEVISHLTFTHMFFPDYWISINGSLWTMALEMQLYLLFPLVLLLYSRHRLPTLVLLVLGSVVFRIAVAVMVETEFPDQFLWSASAPGRLMEFVAGIAAADLVMSYQRQLTTRRRSTLIVAGLLCYLLATAAIFENSSVPLRDLLLSVAFAALVVGVVGSRRGDALLGNRFMSGLGYKSYSVFLVHQPATWYVAEFLRRCLDVPIGTGFFLLLWPTGFLASYALGWVLHVVVERPCIAWSRSWRSTRGGVGTNHLSISVGNSSAVEDKAQGQ